MKTVDNRGFVAVREELAKKCRSGRSVHISNFRYYLKKEYGLEKVCLWCGEPVARLNTYCPGHCVAFWRKYLAQYVAEKMEKATKGKCAACGIHRNDLVKEYWDKYEDHWDAQKKGGKWPQAHAVHHIIPISLGGEPFEEDNLIYLCHECHMEAHTKIREDMALVDQSDDLDETESHLERMDAYWESLGVVFE